METNYITVGKYKGEMDFGVLAAIEELSREEMDELRIMLIVAIGQAESMWRNSQERKHPASQSL
jgi:hypothetical protein